MKAYVAVQRKALILIYTLFKNDVAYDPNFQNQPKEAKEAKETVVQNCRQEQVLPTVDDCSKATSFVG